MSGTCYVEVFPDFEIERIDRPASSRNRKLTSHSGARRKEPAFALLPLVDLFSLSKHDKAMTFDISSQVQQLLT
jgi:hypothetical protein